MTLATGMIAYSYHKEGTKTRVFGQGMDGYHLRLSRKQIPGTQKEQLTEVW